ncbi:unnamed protein product [Rhizophagus irregularis]|nr:unnamed protein product [Rhizophagus irregularis]
MRHKSDKHFLVMELWLNVNLPQRNHYYNAHIQFADTSSVAQFEDTWAIICLGNSLRVCPASYPKSQRDSHREHVAILAGIPKNIKEADLLEIASQVNAKAINIPLSYNSYKPKPYAYFNFSSFENLEAAKELTVAFRGKGLSWHSPNEARELCHVCERHGCSPSKCSPRPAKKLTTVFLLDQDRDHDLTLALEVIVLLVTPIIQPNLVLALLLAKGPASSSHRQQTRPQIKDKAKDINRQDSSSNPGSTSPSSSQNKTSIPPDVIKEIREHILTISPTVAVP